MHIVMAVFAAACAITAAWPAAAAERKKTSDLSVDALISETQSTISTPERLDLVWFVPVEFWQAATNNPSVDAAGRAILIGAIESHFIMITIQADITPLGAFEYFNVKPQALYRAASGTTESLEPLAELPPQMAAMIDVMKPIMSQALGPLGESMVFHVYADRNENGTRRVSPYENGVIEAALSGRDGVARSQHRIELPLDTLHIPRLCANGKPAHISWTHCPWDGTKLPE